MSFNINSWIPVSGPPTKQFLLAVALWAAAHRTMNKHSFLNLGQSCYQPLSIISHKARQKAIFLHLSTTFPQLITNPKYCESMLSLYKLGSESPISRQKKINCHVYKLWQSFHIPLPFLYIGFMCIYMAFHMPATKQTAMASERTITVLRKNMT